MWAAQARSCDSVSSPKSCAVTCHSSLATGGFGFCPEDLERDFLKEPGGDS